VEEAPPPKELVIDARPAPGDATTGSGTAMAPFLFPVIVGGALAKWVSPTAGLAGFALVVALLVVTRKPSEGRFVLRVVEAGVVEVSRERPRTPATRVALADLLDVTLDKETSQARAGSATERVRLALERRAPAEPLFVPDDRITPIEAQEWQSKVRVFLRKHGWVPETERPERDGQ
jgi:hypothetical protein